MSQECQLICSYWFDIGVAGLSARCLFEVACTL